MLKRVDLYLTGQNLLMLKKSHGWSGGLSSEKINMGVATLSSCVTAEEKKTRFPKKSSVK